MRASRLLLGLVAALPGVARGAPGADAAELLVLPPWVVAEPAETSGTPAGGDGFGFTPGSTSVVGRGAWADRGVGTVAEALRGVPGLIAQESFGGFEPPRLSIRGSGLASTPTARGVALLADGLPLARADGSFHTGLFDPQLYEQLEICRGTFHAGGAPAELGGAFNATAVAAGDELRLEVADFQGWRGLFSTGAGSPEAGAQVAGSVASWGGYRVHSGQERAALNARAWWRLAATTTLGLSFYGARAGYEVPGPLTLADAMSRPRSVSAAVTRDQPRRDASLAHLAVQVESSLSGGKLTAGFSVQRLHDDFRQLQANGESDGTSDDLAGRLVFTDRIVAGGVEHHLQAQGSFSIGRNAVDRSLNAAGARGAEFARVGLRGGNGAVSVEDLVWLQKTLGVFGGLNAGWSSRDIEDRLATAGASLTARSLHQAEIAPRAGIQWAPRAGLSLFADASGGVEAPGFDDLLAVSGAAPNLRLRSHALNPQRATTVEAGARGTRGALTWNLVAYHGWWRDEILPLADAAGLPRGSVNAARTIHQGVEAAIRWRLLDAGSKLTLGAAGSWNDFRFADDPVFGRNRLAGEPPCTGSADLLFEQRAGWFVAVDTVWTAGRTPVDQANRLAYGGAVLGGARVGWRWGKTATVYVAARNLFDQRYVASTAGVLDVARTPAATAIFLPGVGRSFTGGIDYRW